MGVEDGRLRLNQIDDAVPVGDLRKGAELPGRRGHGNRLARQRAVRIERLVVDRHRAIRRRTGRRLQRMARGLGHELVVANPLLTSLAQRLCRSCQ